MSEYVDEIIVQATELFEHVNIEKTDDTITLTENGIVFGRVKPHFTSDDHFVGWKFNCLLKDEICSKLYPKDWESTRMLNKVFNTQSDALRELINYYAVGFKLLKGDSCKI